MPESPRHLVNIGEDERARTILAHLRRLREEDQLIELEFLEIKAQKVFEDRLSAHEYPQYQGTDFKSRFMLGVMQYKSLFTVRSNLRRTMVAILIMLVSNTYFGTLMSSSNNGRVSTLSCTMRHSSLNPSVLAVSHTCMNHSSLASTISLLASGVVGVVMFLATIPAVLYIDQWGRKATLIAGSVVMGIAHFVVAGIIAQYDGRWDTRSGGSAAGWAAVVFVWLFAVGFGFSWGPVAWIIVAEVFPLGLRAKGVSLGASSNWLNNFAVAMSTPKFVAAASYGSYIFLGMMCVLGATYVFYLVPETKVSVSILDVSYNLGTHT